MNIADGPAFDHRHDVMDHPGRFEERERTLLHRDFAQRAFTVGVGGPVGSGKTALMLALCTATRTHVRSNQRRLSKP